MVYNITSSKNEKFKHFKALKQKKSRIEFNQYTVEGIKSVKEALEFCDDIECLVVSQEFYKTSDFPYPENIDLYVISTEIFESLSTTENSQGIIAVIRICEKTDFTLDTSKAYIYCDHLQDPGNLGTIIRTADAAGFGGVLLSDECVELYNPKTVRSSMGSFFHIKKLENVTADKIKKFKEKGFLVVCGVLSDNTINYTDADFTKPVIIVIGNEANGITDEILSLSDISIKIPISGSAESLNAAIAAAILMYETNRQRNL